MTRDPATSIHDLDFLEAVAHIERDGYGGMFTGRLYRKAQAERLVREGLLVGEWLDVCDEHGNPRDGCKPRRGYRITDAGRARLDAEHERLEAARMGRTV